MKLGILTSHPIQYQAPLFRELARHVDLTVYFAHRQTPAAQAEAGFGVAFEWDVDLLSGYRHEFLENVAQTPDTGRFFGCDTPSVRQRIAEGNFDAFLVMGWHLKCFWQAVFACQRAGVPVMVLLILVMMLVPLPALLLDLLFTLNIGMAIMVLIAALNVKNFKDFVSFPTLLLITTLMRLSLNVASTRIVLLNGHSGTDAAGNLYTGPNTEDTPADRKSVV